MNVKQAYRFTLCSTPSQEQMLRSHLAAHAVTGYQARRLITATAATLEQEPQ